MIKPVGWQLLIKPHAGPKKIGNIHLADQTADANKIASTVAQVVSMGPDAYKDEVKFPNGPWCAVGDWVVIGKMAGARFAYDNEEYRLIDDDKILGLTDEPDKVSRIIV